MEYLVAFTAVTMTTAASMTLIWLLDRFEKEPIWLLTLVFLWGAVPAIILSLIFEMIAGVPLSMLFEATFADVLMGSIVAPVVEESAKMIALLVVFFLLRHELDDILDGIVFGAAVGVGFAWVEDLAYIFGAGSEGGVEAMTFVFVLRVFVFGLNHAFFTALAGLGFGIAKVTRSCWLGGIAVLFFFGLAMGAHFLHNTLVSVAGDAGVIISILVHWSGLFGLLLVVVGAWLAEWHWIKKELGEEVQNGTIGERDYRQATKWFGRIGWELKFLFAGDLVGFFRVRKMFNMLVKLAFLKRSFRRHPKDSTKERLAQHRTRLQRYRAKFA